MAYSEGVQRGLRLVLVDITINADALRKEEQLIGNTFLGGKAKQL